MARRARRCRHRTVLDDPSKRPSTSPSAARSRTSCASPLRGVGSPRSWCASWRSTSAAACSRTGSPASAAPDAETSCWSRSPVSGEGCVPPAAPGAPAMSPHTWWTTCFPARPTDSGRSRFPSGSAGHWRATRRCAAKCSPSSSARCSTRCVLADEVWRCPPARPARSAALPARGRHSRLSDETARPRRLHPPPPHPARAPPQTRRPRPSSQVQSHSLPRGLRSQLQPSRQGGADPRLLPLLRRHSPLHRLPQHLPPAPPE